MKKMLPTNLMLQSLAYFNYIIVYILKILMYNLIGWFTASPQVEDVPVFHSSLKT